MKDIQKLVRIAQATRKHLTDKNVKPADVENGVALILARTIQPSIAVSIDEDIVYHQFVAMNVKPEIESIFSKVNEQCLIDLVAVVGASLVFHRQRTMVALGQCDPDVWNVLIQNSDMPQYLAQSGLKEPLAALLSKDAFSLNHTLKC